MAIGLVSGAMGPFSNAPIDTIKTRLQKSPGQPGQSALSRITAIAEDMWKQEGVRSFYKGITPRVLRVAPGESWSLRDLSWTNSWTSHRTSDCVCSLRAREEVD
jgi:hypothetical protein